MKQYFIVGGTKVPSDKYFAPSQDLVDLEVKKNSDLHPILALVNRELNKKLTNSVQVWTKKSI